MGSNVGMGGLASIDTDGQETDQKNDRCKGITTDPLDNGTNMHHKTKINSKSL